MRNLKVAIPMYAILLSTLLTGMSLVGCEDTATDPDPSDLIVGRIEDAGPFPAPAEPADDKDPIGDASCSVTGDGTQWSCQDYGRDVVQISDDFPVFTDHGLYPGQLVQGASLGGIPDPITAPRGSGSLFLTDINGGTVNTQSVDEVTSVSVIEAANTIIRNHSSELPADFSLRIQQIRSEHELHIALQVSASYFGLFKSTIGFDYDEGGNKSYFLASIRQTFYSLGFERPQQPREFFAPEAVLADVAPHVGPGNPPAYIDQMAYGRVFFLLIESTESATEMEGSLDASFAYGLFGGIWDSDMRYMNSLDGFDIQAYAYGGDTASAMASIIVGRDAFRDFFQSLEAGAEIGTAKPLAWRARAVLDDKLVHNGYSAQYQYTECSPTGSVGAPTLLSPEDESATVDNGCSCVNDAIQWDFDWRKVAGATRYEFRLAHPDFDPIVKRVDRTRVSIDFDQPFRSAAATRGWTWRVRAETGCGWGPWSRQRMFGTEAIDSDCKTGLTLFGHKNYEGPDHFFSNDIADLGLVDFNNKATSIRLHNVKRVILYGHKNFEGRRVVIEVDTPNFRTLEFNDAAGSLKIVRCR